MLELSLEVPFELRHSDLRHGHGLFETLRIQQGQVRWLPLHLQRLAEGCAFLGLPEVPPADQVSEFLSPLLPREGVLHLTAVDGRLWVRVGPGPGPDLGPVGIGISTRVTRCSRSPLNRFKTLSYLENRLLHQEADRRGCFEILARNEAGHLTDGGRTSLFLQRGGGWFTPSAADGALPGIARRVLLEAGLAQEGTFVPRDLEAAEAVCLVNALRGVVVVRGSWADAASLLG